MSLYRIFKKNRNLLENRLRQTDPRAVFPASQFTWTHAIEALHPQIKEECLNVLKNLSEIPNFDQILPGQRALVQAEQWKAFYLVALAKPVKAHARLCPHTMRALQNVPHLLNAFFSVLQPGTSIPTHRGPYSGILRYHLGVLVPTGDVGIRIGDQLCHWQEGKSLVFDDGFAHSVWNHTQQLRVVLFVDFARPLPAAWDLLNRSIIYFMGFSKEARHAQQVIEKQQIEKR